MLCSASELTYIYTYPSCVSLSAQQQALLADHPMPTTLARRLRCHHVRHLGCIKTERATLCLLKRLTLSRDGKKIRSTCVRLHQGIPNRLACITTDIVGHHRHQAPPVLGGKAVSFDEATQAEILSGKNEARHGGPNNELYIRTVPRAKPHACRGESALGAPSLQ